MNFKKAIGLKQHYQYLVQYQSLPDLIDADNLSIEAMKRISAWRDDNDEDLLWDLPGETEGD